MDWMKRNAPCWSPSWTRVARWTKRLKLPWEPLGRQLCLPFHAGARAAFWRMCASWLLGTMVYALWAWLWPPAWVAAAAAWGQLGLVAQSLSWFVEGGGGCFGGVLGCWEPWKAEPGSQAAPLAWSGPAWGCCGPVWACLRGDARGRAWGCMGMLWACVGVLWGWMGMVWAAWV